MLKLFLLQSIYFTPATWAGADLEIYQAFNCSTYLTQFRYKGTTPEEPLEILTPRLILRSAGDSDYDSIVKLYSDIETVQKLFGHWQTWDRRDSWMEHRRLMSHPRDRTQSNPSVLRFFQFVIALRVNNKAIGTGSLRQYADRWEFSVAVMQEYRNQGYATERLEGLISFVRSFQPDATFRAEVLATNLESQAVLKKFKFRKDKSSQGKTVWTYWLYPER